MNVDDMISPKAPAPSCEYCPFDALCLGAGYCVLQPKGRLLTNGPHRTVAA